VTRTSHALRFLGALLLAPAANAALPLPALKGETYDHARAQIIKLGYQPVRFVRTEDGCLFDKSCNRYPELLNCSPKQPDQCQFAFIERAHQKYIVITTKGQSRRVADVKSASDRERKAWPLIQRSRRK
jgi:hypothetical protein